MKALLAKSKQDAPTTLTSVKLKKPLSNTVPSEWNVHG